MYKPKKRMSVTFPNSYVQIDKAPILIGWLPAAQNSTFASNINGNYSDVMVTYDDNTTIKSDVINYSNGDRSIWITPTIPVAGRTVFIYFCDNLVMNYVGLYPDNCKLFLPIQSFEDCRRK